MNQSLVTIDLTTFTLSEHDNIMLQPVFDGIEFSHVRDGSKPYPLATFNAGKWSFSNDHDRSMFLQLMQSYPKEFRRLFKKYFQVRKKPKFYTITCARRKFTIWQQRIHNTLWDKIYNTFYAR
jgi:hypothetical protein